MKSSPSAFFRVAAVVFTLGATFSRAAVLFDGVSDVAALGASAGAFKGEAINLDAGFFSAAGNSVNSFEVGVANVTGAAITARPLRLNMWLYLTYSPSASAAPAFSDQVGPAGAPTLVFNFASATVNNGSAAMATLPLAAPLILTPTSGTTIGIALNWQVDMGAGFVNLPGLTTPQHVSVPPSVGSNATGTSPNFGFYANLNGETNGNFLGTSITNAGPDSGLWFRISGPNVPEPATTALGAVVGLTLLSRRRR